MDKGIDTTIKNYLHTIVSQNIGLTKAYLFGSYARNNQREESDIDIALIVNDLDDSNKFDLQVQLLLLASKFDNRIEPHVISNIDFLAENPFAYEIMKTGIEIEFS
jgi:predicted nucleotidyltransferase